MAFDDFSFEPGQPAAQPQPPERAPVPEPEPLPWPPSDAPRGRPGPRAQPTAAAPSPTAARAKAGLGVLTAAAGVGLGAVLGGPLGALAGLTGVGAARNLYRSQAIASSDPSERGDAARSLAIGVVGLAALGYLGYKIWNSKEGD